VGVRTLFGALALLLTFAAPAAAVPNASYRVTPDPPVANQPATYESTSTSVPPMPAPIARVDWDFTGSPAFELTGQRVAVMYQSSGLKFFRMRVTDTRGAVTIEGFTVLVSGVAVPANSAPVAQFRFSPTTPLLGQEVLFESLSYDPDGTVASYQWDFDGDGFDDGSTAQVAHAFGSAGAKAVRLRVTDNGGSSSEVAAETFTVLPLPANRLPVAQFSVSDRTPAVGQRISLRSFSYDPDGAIRTQRWDTDGDGDFDENVTGATATKRFRRAGSRIVRLRVEDSRGGFQTETVHIRVRRRSVLMYPFPVVRLAGRVIDGGAQVRTLEVRAPRRSRITVKCRGDGCPAKRLRTTSAAPRVLFKRMVGFLPGGTVIAVRVRKGSLVGKYTRWVIRATKLPARKDLCLYPDSSKPARCPA
jgi:PKD repeat protein